MTAYIFYGDKNFDTCPSASINATLDTYTINGAQLTVDTDTRYCPSRQGSGPIWGAGAGNGSVDTVTISAALGGSLFVDGTKVKLIPYVSGSGMIYALSGALAITAATWTTGSVLLTSLSHGLGASGSSHKIKVGGLEPNEYNGLFTGSVTGPQTIVYPLTSDPGVSTITNGHYVKYYPCDQTQTNVPTVLTWAGGVVTVTAPNHQLVTGNRVVVSGVTPGGYNGTYDIAYVDSNTFTYLLTGDPGGDASVMGTVVKTVNATFLGFWNSFIAPPTPSGSFAVNARANIPFGGFIKVKDVVNGPFISGSLTFDNNRGISPAATSIGNEIDGWIEVVGAETATITVPRLGNCTMTGSWFYPRLMPNGTNQITRSGTTVTVVSATAHNAKSGSFITMGGAVPYAYNGTYRITSVPTTASLTYELSADPGLDATTLGNFTVQVCTSGIPGQTIQFPAPQVSGTLPGVWIETGSTGTYEFWPQAGALYSTGSIITSGSVGKVCWMNNTGSCYIGQDYGGGVGWPNGHVPEAGSRIRIPNIITVNTLRTAASGSGVNRPPHGSLPQRVDFTTTGGGVIDIRQANLAWYPIFQQAYSVNLQNVAIHDQILVSEIAAPLTWDNVGVGCSNHSGSATSIALRFVPLSMTTMFAGGSINNCTWAHRGLNATGIYGNTLTDCYNFSFSNQINRALGPRLHATTGILNLARVFDTTWNNVKLIGGRTLITTCGDLTFTSASYLDRIDSQNTIATYPHYAFDLTTVCDGIKIDGLDFFGLREKQPYSGILNLAAACKNIKLRNIGSPTVPLDLGRSYQTSGSAYVVVAAAAAGCTNLEFKRIYVTGSRTGISSFDNSINGVIYENVWGDNNDLLTVASLNTQVRGMKARNIQAGQTSIYGHHFQDYFVDDTFGNIVVVANEKTSVSPSITSYTVTTASSVFGFNSVGALMMPTANDEIIYQTPNIIGHTAIRTGSVGVIIPATGVTALTVSAASWASGSTTVRTSADHKLQPGDTIVVSGVTQAAYNGNYVVTAIPNSITIKYAQAVNPGTWGAGGSIQVPYLAITAGSWSSNYTTITTVAHGLKAGDTITIVDAEPAAYNGTYVLTNVTATTMRYYQSPSPDVWVRNGTIRPITNLDFWYDIDTGSGYSETYKNLRYCKTDCRINSVADGIITLTSSAGISSGNYVYGKHVGLGAVVNSVDSATQITLSVNNILTSSYNTTCYFNHLPNEIIPSASVGFGLKIKARARVNTQIAGFLYLNIPTVSSAVAQQYQYSLDTATVVVTNLTTNSRVKITKTSDGTVLYNNVETAGSVTFVTDYIGSITVEARNASPPGPYYQPWISVGTTVAGSTSTFVALQTRDDQ